MKSPILSIFFFAAIKKLCNVRSRCRRCQWHECSVNYLNFTIGWLSFRADWNAFWSQATFLLLNIVQNSFLLRFPLRALADKATRRAKWHDFRLVRSLSTHTRLSLPKVKIKPLLVSRRKCALSHSRESHLSITINLRFHFPRFRFISMLGF